MPFREWSEIKQKSFPGLQTHLLPTANSTKVPCRRCCPAGARAWAQVVQRTVGHWGLAQHLSERFGACSLVFGDGAEGLYLGRSVALCGDVEGQVGSACFLPKGLKPSKSNSSYTCDISHFYSSWTSIPDAAHRRGNSKQLYLQHQALWEEIKIYQSGPNYRQLPPQEPNPVLMANALFSILRGCFQSLLSCCPQPVLLCPCFLLCAPTSHEVLKERSPIPLLSWMASQPVCCFVFTSALLEV